MAKKETRVAITANNIEESKKEVTLDVNGIGELNVKIRYTLNLHDMLQLVEDVVSSVVDGEANTYIPEIHEFALQAGIVKAYTNIKLPQSAEKQYDIIYRTDLFQRVIQHIDFNQLNQIRNAVADRIEHEVAMIESALAQNVNTLIAEVGALIDSFENSFGNVDGSDVAGFIKNLAQMDGMTEEALAKAVLDAQRNEKKVSTNVISAAPFMKKN